MTTPTGRPWSRGASNYTWTPGRKTNFRNRMYASTELLSEQYRTMSPNSGMHTGNFDMRKSYSTANLNRVPYGSSPYYNPYKLDRSTSSPKPSTPPPNQFKLVRINGQNVDPNSRACFEHLKGHCPAGVLCRFEHDGMQPYQHKICDRMLRGKCRTRPGGSTHQLKEYQLPICQFYLDQRCFDDKCHYLHIKWTAGHPSCYNFNKGNCQLGKECDKSHHYDNWLIHKVGREHTEGNTFNEDEGADRKESAPLKWYDNSA